MHFKTVAFALLVLALALPSMGQEQRGSIEGIVTDASGAVLPGAIVEVQSAVGVVQRSTTDATGGFRFPSLPPGTYSVTASLSGFTARTLDDVTLSLGQIKKVDVALPVPGVTVTVNVTAAQPMIDVRQSARSTSIRAEQIELLPRGRDFTTLVTQAPGANQEAKLGGLSIERFQIRYTIRQQKKFPGARFPVTMSVGSRNTEELREILYSGANRVAVRRELADVWAAMPPITHNRYTISLSSSPELTAALADLRSMSRAQVEDKLAAKDPALSTMRRLIGLGKVAAAADVIAERAADTAGAVLVGAWHTEVIDGLCAATRAKGLRCEILDGRTSLPRKAALEAAFNAGEIDVLVGQIGAMGVSLNLQRGGNCIIVVEEDWSPAIMDQFYARLYRMGQERHVHVDTLETETKIDEAIHKISREKARHHQKLNAGEEA